MTLLRYDSDHFKIIINILIRDAAAAPLAAGNYRAVLLILGWNFNESALNIGTYLNERQETEK